MAVKTSPIKIIRFALGAGAVICGTATAALLITCFALNSATAYYIGKAASDPTFAYMHDHATELFKPKANDNLGMKKAMSIVHPGDAK